MFDRNFFDPAFFEVTMGVRYVAHRIRFRIGGPMRITRIRRNRR